ncbi:serine/threonine-protein phosphatase 7 long form-like protein [Trifolium medium]|uniref:Serine/threonine-protein phosphatase 7 long form-like protein n=1 Tax=Trifolium medium TaxID=97028 RepID=A0A392NF80_9FABA|nr:serine/threonine-protein phosphatase 7 long form-like protein [Trifolium medium]
MVDTYAWAPIALAFLYRELSSATIPKCRYLVGYLNLLQVWIYHHFNNIGKEESAEYREHMPCATKYDPT